MYAFLTLLGYTIINLILLSSIYVLLLASSVWKFFYFNVPILPSDVINLRELFNAVGTLTQLKFLLLFCLLGLHVYFLIRKSKKPEIKKVLMAIGLLVTGILPLGKIYNQLLNEKNYQSAFPDRNLAKLGMTTAFLMEYMESRKNIEIPNKQEMEEIYNRYGNKEALNLMDPSKTKKNIYIIIVESFWNVDDIFVKEGSSFSDGFLEKYKADGQKNAIVNDKYLGTSKTEFEVLCGFPHLGDAVLFKANLSKKNICLPNILKKLGYKTNAYHPYKRFFYNRDYAYPAIGFETYESMESFQINKNDTFMNDRDFFKQVLKKIEDKNKADKQPKLHYILTVATHYPFSDNVLASKRAISVNSKTVSDYVNSVHVATDEISRFIDKITESDPQALFLVLGDHAPPLGVNYFNIASKKKRGKSFGEAESLFVPLLTFGFKESIPQYVSTYYLEKFILKEIGQSAHMPSYQLLNTKDVNFNYKKNMILTSEGFIQPEDESIISKEEMNLILMDEVFGNQHLKKILSLKKSYDLSTN